MTLQLLWKRSRGFDKLSQDVTALVDTVVPLISLIANGNDITAIVETIVRSFDKSLSESTAIVKAPSLGVNKPYTESTALLETFDKVVDFRRPMTESTSLVDLYSDVVVFQRSFTDTSVMTETVAKDAANLPWQMYRQSQKHL